MKRAFAFSALLIVLTACAASQSPSGPTPGVTDVAVSTGSPQSNLPNPASVYCEEQGFTLEIRTAQDGSQDGVCVFLDGSECDEWAFFRGECVPAGQNSPTSGFDLPAPDASPTDIPTPMPIDPADYESWWTYTHPVYRFSIKLPGDWIVEEVTTSDPAMNGHTLNLHPRSDFEEESIYMAFRRTGEEARLWPTGAGEGKFLPHGTLEIAGQGAERVLLVCPNGEVAAIWYHQAEGQPNITRGNMEFGFIFRANPSHCEAGYSLGGKEQHAGEMVIASLETP